MSRATRGLVWIGLGIALWVIPLIVHRPLTLRGTPVPLGPLFIGLGLILLAWDTRAKRKAPGTASRPADRPPASP